VDGARSSFACGLSTPAQTCAAAKAVLLCVILGLAHGVVVGGVLAVVVCCLRMQEAAGLPEL
jgi:MFS superfamily sulfate permease-like transporter